MTFDPGFRSSLRILSLGALILSLATLAAPAAHAHGNSDAGTGGPVSFNLYSPFASSPNR